MENTEGFQTKSGKSFPFLHFAGKPPRNRENFFEIYHFKLLSSVAEKYQTSNRFTFGFGPGIPQKKKAFRKSEGF